MNEFQALEQYSVLANRWESFSKSVDSAYNKLYNNGTRKNLANSFPKKHSDFLQKYASGQFRDQLQNQMQLLLANAGSASDAKAYLGAIGQLVAFVGKIAGGTPQPAQSVPQSPVAQPAPPTQPITDAPPKHVTDPMPGIIQPKPPVAIQQRLDQSTLEIARQIEQAQAALAETRQQLEAFRLQTGHSLASLVTMQDWTDVAGELYTSEDSRRKTRNSLAAKLVDVVVGCEQQYLISTQHISHGETAGNDAESPFQATVRSIIGRFEHVLATEFSVMRMPIVPGSAPDPNSMTWNKDAFETPPTRELAGRVAYVAAPGFYSKRADGNRIYWQAQVVLYAPWQ